MRYLIVPEKGISDFYFCRVFSDYSQFSQCHSHIEFIFSLSGEINITIDEKMHTAQSGELCVVMPYEIHSISTPEHSEIFIIACPPDYLTEYRQILINNKFTPPKSSFGDAAKALMSDIINSDFKDDFKKKALVYCAISELMQKSTLVKQEPTEFDLYRKAIAYISEHYKENLSLEAVAQYACVTPAHLSRVINQRSKSSFCDILNSLRIYEAKGLIEQKGVSISDAAYEAGYGSIRNFNRIFKKYFAATPKEYLKINRK